MPSILVHDLRATQKRAQAVRVYLWSWHRATAWRRVHAVMQEAGITGPQACPKALRHSFGIRAVNAGIPLNMVQKWLGDAQLSTTAIYADAVGAEEQAIAAKMWGRPYLIHTITCIVQVVAGLLQAGRLRLSHMLFLPLFLS